MKFVIGLLIGTLAVLALASAKDFSWEPPKRSDFVEKIALAEPASLSSSAPARPQIKSVTIEPLQAEPEPERSPQPIVSSAMPKLAQPTQAPPAQPDTLAEEPVTAPVTKEPNETLETAVVWKPFHSEVSADGFARRLSTQLGYPFRALREGPAKYHVVFDYESQEQREMLRAQVEALTGFSLI